MKRLLRTIWYIAVGLLLTACNFSSTDSEEDTSADGVWTGTLSWNSGEAGTDIIALSYKERLTVIANTEALLFDGFYDVENRYLLANVDEHALDGAAADYRGQARLSGMVSEHQYMLLDVRASDGTRGELALQYLEDVYQRSTSLADLDGLWAYAGVTVNEDLVLQIEDDGDLFGQDGYGCIFDGAFTRPSRNHNIYRVAMDVTGCGDYNGRYDGLATRVDASRPDDTLLLSVSNGRHAFYYDFTRTR